MKVILVDDEKHARENLKRRLLKIDSKINIVEEAYSATDAFIKIKNHEPDLVFLDVEMPEGDGFSMLEKFQSINFDVIFVTAYTDFALKAFELMAIGYITKPIDNELLSKVYHRAKAKKSIALSKTILETISSTIESLSNSSKVSIPTESGLELVESDEIVIFKSSDGYTTIELDNGRKILSSKRLKYFEEKIGSNFRRMHKSFIVNTNYIKKYHKAGIVILKNGNELPVGRKYKKDIELLFN